MPLVEVKLYDTRVTEEAVPKIIEAMTDALVESSGVPREYVWVIVEGVPAKHWGVAGKPGG
jgi:4-oxalocrotonate tautomerase